MKNFKSKLKAIWKILKADGFDVAVTYPTERGFMFDSMSTFGSDNNANIVHYHIGSYFSRVVDCIYETNEEMKERQ